jgi:hypothetical protein
LFQTICTKSPFILLAKKSKEPVEQKADSEAEEEEVAEEEAVFLKSFQIRQLLQEVEAKDCPRSSIKLLSICKEDPRHRIYGKPGSPL